MSAQVLLVECGDRPGLVHAITGVLFRRGLNVVGNEEFVDRDSARFFMRTEIEGEMDAERIQNGLQGILPTDAQILISEKKKKKVVILVTKEHHCLGELLVRHQFGDLNAEILAVIGNHDVLKNFTERFDIPFYFITHENKTREQHEAEILAKIKEIE